METELHRDSVQTWECDQMGHLNVQFYMEKAMSGVAALLTEMGLGPRSLSAQGLRVVARDHHVRFLREQRPGAPYYLVGGVVEASADTLVIYEEMRTTVGDVPAATFRGEYGFEEIASGDRVAVPEALLARCEDFRVDIPKHGQPRGLLVTAPRAPISLKAAEDMGTLRTYQGQIQPSAGHPDGRLRTRFFMGLVSDSIPNLLAQTRGDDRSRNDRIGGAALEYRFVYHRFPHVGDVVKLRSGLKEVADKTYTWSHLLFDAETGEMLAASEAVAISFDLVDRKAIPVPDEMKTLLQSMLVDGIGV